MEPTRYAVYKAAKTQNQIAQPCIHQIALSFGDFDTLNQAVETECSICGRNHEFNIDKTYVVTTPHELDRFLDWCKTQQVELLDTLT